MLAKGRTTRERRGGAAGLCATARVGRFRARRHGVDAGRPGDVFQVRLAEVDESRPRPSRARARRRAREAHAARLGDALEPRRDVDAVAQKVVAFDEDVAEMNADAIDDALAFGQVRVALGHHALHRERAFGRRNDRGKLDEQGVAHRLEEPPAVRGDDRRRGLAPLAHRFRRAGLVLAHHARIADDVGGEDRGKLADGGHVRRSPSSPFFRTPWAGRPVEEWRSQCVGLESRSAQRNCAR